MSGIGTVVNVSGATVGNTAETAVLTVPFASGNSANVPLSAPPGVGSVCKNFITGAMNITIGASATAIAIKCRQGNNTVVGTQIGPTRNYTVVAGNIYDIPINFYDLTSGYGQAYTITVTQTGGTAAGTVNSMRVEVTDFN